MRPRVLAMRPRVLALILAGPLGLGLALIPGWASGGALPDAASFTAADFSWQVTGTGGQQATIAAGGTVSFGYPTGSNMHNADFGTGPQPSSCTQASGADTGAVPPLPHKPTAPGWSGSCRFDTPGTYTFHCDLHSFMTGTIVVEAPTITTTTTSPAPTGTTTATTPTTTTPTTPTGTTTTTSPPPPATTPTTPAAPRPPGGPLLNGPAARAVRVPARQRGTAIAGSVELAPAANAGRLEVDLTVDRGQPGARRGPLTVGRLVRRSLRSGTVGFRVALSAAGRRLLARAGGLRLTASITLTAVDGRRHRAARHVLLLAPARR